MVVSRLVLQAVTSTTSTLDVSSLVLGEYPYEEGTLAHTDQRHSVGFLVMIVPLYQAEIAHPSIRGRVTALQQFMLGIGAFIAAWCTYGTNNNMSANTSAQWRVPLGIQMIPALVLACLIMLFPESPRVSSNSVFVAHFMADRYLVVD